LVPTTTLTATNIASGQTPRLVSFMATVILSKKLSPLRWYEHVNRLRDDEADMGGKTVRKKATPEMERQHQADLAKMNIPLDTNLLEDRKDWRSIVQSAKTHPGL